MIMLLFFLSAYIKPNLAVMMDMTCVIPLLKCPNENITFFLYTRDTQDNPYQLFANDSNNLNNAPFVENAPIKVLIHGYRGNKDALPNSAVRPAYFQMNNYSIISVDFAPLAREPCYQQASTNTRLVGKCTAQLIDSLVRNGRELRRFHVIGFSLGAQSAGFTGNFVKSGSLERITGLDASREYFMTADRSQKLDSTDAKFVDVLHTNSLGRGKLETSGDVDFYANRGFTQPGCRDTANQSKILCDHRRSVLYFAESITTDVGFYATRCPTSLSYMLGFCEGIGTEEILFGEYVPYGSRGIYFFRTNAQSPYARGRNNGNGNTNQSDIY